MAEAEWGLRRARLLRGSILSPSAPSIGAISCGCRNSRLQDKHRVAAVRRPIAGSALPASWAAMRFRRFTFFDSKSCTLHVWCAHVRTDEGSQPATWCDAAPFSGACVLLVTNFVSQPNDGVSCWLQLCLQGRYGLGQHSHGLDCRFLVRLGAQLLFQLVMHTRAHKRNACESTSYTARVTATPTNLLRLRNSLSFVFCHSTLQPLLCVRHV